MRYLVTGGAGFIGSAVVRALASERHQVTVLDDLSTGQERNLRDLAGRGVQLEVGSIADPALVARLAEGCHGIFHLAAIASVQRTMDEPGLCHRVNAGGTVHVLEAARLRHVPRVVFSSSAAVYGEADSFPLSEDAPGLPISPYGLHKLIGEQYGRMYSRLGWTQVVSLRYFNVFGPRQDPNSDYAAVIPKFITAVRKGLPPAIFGDGTQSRDFVFVDDVARVNVLAMQSPALLPGSYNVCTGAEWSLLDLVGELSRCAGREVVPHFEPARPGDIRRSVGSPAKLHDALGFSPPSALGPGLAATWQWYRDEPAA